MVNDAAHIILISFNNDKTGKEDIIFKSDPITLTNIMKLSFPPCQFHHYPIYC